METTLHRQLKELYSADPAQREVWVDGYRVDAVVDGRLIEIQQASLSALRDKTRCLLSTHDVIVVKPLAAAKLLIRRDRRGGEVVSKRTSPRRQTILNLFEELVHFIHLFPHPRLTLEVLLTRQEEDRLTVVKRRRRGKDYRVEDRRLVEVVSRSSLRTVADLQQLLPPGLVQPFSTEALAQAASIPRWLAQKMAYCLRCAGAIEVTGKEKNSILYRVPRKSRRRRAA